MKAMVAPRAPASVGVQMPMRMPPITNTITTSSAQTSFSAISFSLAVVLGPRGPAAGLILHQPKMTTQYRAAISRPGTMPEISRVPMEVPVIMP